MCKMYGIIEGLCTDRGIKPGKMCADLGISRGIMGDLKAGRTKKLSAENIEKVSNYFGVSSDYLFGNTEKAPTDNGERKISDDEIKAAFFEGADDLSKEEMDAMWDDARDYIQYKLEQRRRKKDD